MALKPWTPKKWEGQWALIKEMRGENPAAVDTMGAHCLRNPETPLNDQAFQTLVGLMLSAQTKDEVTSATMKTLIYEKGLSIDMVMKTSEADLNEYISAVGFHNKKAKYIKDTTKIIVEQYKGIVPKRLDQLLDFPGVGPKMAHLLLQICFDQVEGISVDTHVHRIANRLNWVKPETSTPEKTAASLESWLPHSHWG